MQEGLQRDLLSYYKWLISISISVISLSIGAIKGFELKFSNTLIVGLVLLTVQVFFAWLVIKNLLFVSVVRNTVPENLMSFMDTNIKRIGFYGKIQNFAFIIGLILVILSFIFSLNPHVLILL